MSENVTKTQHAWTQEQARTLALKAGFSEAGLVALPHARELRDGARFEDWIQAGRAGSMNYLLRRSDDGALLRTRVDVPFPWARSALVCMANYHSAHPRSTDPAPPATGWIARYAWSSRSDENDRRRPSDYHKVLLKRLRAIEATLHQSFPDVESRAFVDTGPVLERSLAAAAGLGWTGKNTCLIHPRIGSYAFLGVLLTSLPAEQEDAAPTLTPDRCGSCRRCLEACPTGALIAPHEMDATRCISYLTIEHRSVIAEELMNAMGRQVFGCDICQDVCPWNRKAPIGSDPGLQPRQELVNPTLEWLAALDEPHFEQTFNGSPVRRAGWNGLRRNLAIAMGNSGLAEYLPRLREWAEAADEGLRAAARRGMEKIENVARDNGNGAQAGDAVNVEIVDYH